MKAPLAFQGTEAMFVEGAITAQMLWLLDMIDTPEAAREVIAEVMNPPHGTSLYNSCLRVALERGLYSCKISGRDQERVVGEGGQDYLAQQLWVENSVQEAELLDSYFPFTKARALATLSYRDRHPGRWRQEVRRPMWKDLGMLGDATIVARIAAQYPGEQERELLAYSSQMGQVLIYDIAAGRDYWVHGAEIMPHLKPDFDLFSTEPL